MESIAIIKQHVQFKTDTNVYKINSIANEIFFITKGKIQLFDGYMNLCGEFEANEILGHKELTEYINIKLMNNNEKDDDENKSVISKKSASSKKGTALDEIGKSEERTIKRKHYAIAKENTEYMSLGFHVLEELINADNSILFKINEHVKQQKAVINQYDINYTTNIIDAFDVNEKSGVIVLKDDSIYRCNPALQENIDELGDVKG